MNSQVRRNLIAGFVLAGTSLILATASVVVLLIASFFLGSQWATWFGGQKLVPQSAYVLRSSEKAVPVRARVALDDQRIVPGGALVVTNDAPRIGDTNDPEWQKLKSELRQDFKPDLPDNTVIEVRRYHSLIFVLFFASETPGVAPVLWGIWNYEGGHWQVYFIDKFYHDWN